MPLSRVIQTDTKDRGLPLVSIVIPSYKSAFFEQTLKSALGQTYPNIQILVFDNCPDDDIKNICAKYPNILYQRSYFTRGDNIRSALFAGAGKYIKPLFDDDILHPFCIEYFVSALENNDNIAFVYSTSSIINQKNIRTRTRKRYETDKIFSANEFLDLILSGPTNPVGEMSTIMFSKKTLWSIGLYHEYFDDFYFNGLSDLVIYINLSLQGDVMYLQDELSYFRRDNESGYMSNSNPAYNPSFGYCFADYFNILRLCDERGLVKNIDFSNLGFGYYNLVYVVSKTYPQVMESYELFCNYVKNKYNIVVGFRDIVEGHIDQDLFVFNEMSVLEAFYKADEFIKQNQPVKAEKFYRLWLHFNQNVTNRYIIYHLLGLLLASLHKLDEAKICFEQAIQIQPDFYKSQFSLAEIHIKQNNVDLAVPLLKQVVGSNPDDESDKAIIDAANRLLKEIRYESK